MTAKLFSYIGSGRATKLSEGERIAVTIMIVGLLVILLSWAITVLVRYNFREKMIRRRMQWSSSKDPFWNYDSIIQAAKENYCKAQVLLSTNPLAFLKRLSPYAQARLRIFTKGIRSEKDIEFLDAYVVCFDDKVQNAGDSVAVYLEVRVKKRVRFREILTMYREGDEWRITEYVQNPTMFMISHARSIVEKS
jgi:hypothetical protein